MSKQILRWAGWALILAAAAGCAGERATELAPMKDYYRRLAPGEPALRKVTDPALIPDFRPGFLGDRAALLEALAHSIRYFEYPSSRKYYPVQDITHERAAASLVAFRDILISSATPEEFHRRIVRDFDVYESVGCDDMGTVLFTGYYTPIFRASLTPSAEFRWPLYRLPSDLVKGPEGETLGRRAEDGSLVPYYTRAQIEAGALKGNELVYLRDRFEAYICTVQGSAHLVLPDGTLYRVGYAGNNGHEYVSVGRLLVEDGLLPEAQLTLHGLMRFFQEHPEAMDRYLPRNPRYVFFAPTDQPPTGSLGLPVTPYRTIATDKSLFPRGALAFVRTYVPAPRDGASGALDAVRFEQFVLDQDTGGGIRTPGRCDLYLGIGEEAGRIAGWTFSEGRLYYLFLKEGREGAPSD